MDPIKVLVVDENILVRRAVTNILQKNDLFEVSWIADHSSVIEETISDNYPDVMLLSVNDLNSEGFSILSTIRLRFPNLPVIALCPRDEHGAEAAISALRLGAVDFITKPEHKNLILFAERHLQKRLVPLIKTATQKHACKDISVEILESLAQPQQTIAEVRSIEESPLVAEIVVIGGCTGGVQALFTIVGSLPTNLKVPVVIVQHLPRKYTSYLASKLDTLSSLRVREGQNGVHLEGGDIWIAPGGFQCEIAQDGQEYLLTTHRGLRENNMRPSIDILFRSAARVFREKTLGIVLSGCGYDGFEGAGEIRRNKGQIIIQDPRSAVAPSLPLNMLKKGFAKDYYSPRGLAKQIIKRSQTEESKISMEENIIDIA